MAGHAAGGDGFVTAMMCMKDGPVRTYRPMPQAEAREMLARMVAQAMKPMKLDFATVQGQEGRTASGIRRGPRRLRQEGRFFVWEIGGLLQMAQYGLLTNLPPYAGEEFMIYCSLLRPPTGKARQKTVIINKPN